MADLSDNDEDTWDISICSIGIMGTKYVRDELLQDSIELIKG